MARLIDLNPPVKYMGEFLREITMGFERSQILFTAFELGMFTKLKKPMTSEALIREMGLNPEITARFMDSLTAMNLLCKKGGYYQTAPELVPFLVEDEPYFSLYLKSALRERKTWMNLKEVLVEGTLLKPEKEKFAYTRESLEWTARDCMHRRLQKTLKLVSSLPEFKRARRLIDLGGGHGLFAIGFAQENPHLEAFVYDRPEITGLTQEYIEKYGVQERVKVLSGDYLHEDFGTGYDIVFEALSLEGGPKEAKILYQKTAEALKPEGLFITQLFTLDDSGTSPLPTLTLDLREKVTGHRQLHLMTNAALFELFNKVGLSGEQVLDISMGTNLPMRMVIARKKT
ncbi:methyltransferase family protein [Methanosarcina sp. Mfa9]|uniref:methyltransferase family protein n=1 Tax=Methanosarcina sp. Mfa9 TaxID=3439063 RepID=UPI003F83D360